MLFFGYLFIYVLKFMFFKLLCFIILGLIVVGILLVVMFMFCSLGYFFFGNGDSVDEEVFVSYNQVVCRVVFVVVNVYNCSLSFIQDGLVICILGFGVIMSDKGYIFINKYVINNVE